LIKTWAVQSGNVLNIAIIHKNLNGTTTKVVLDFSNSAISGTTTFYAIRLIGEPLQKENIMLAGQTWTGSTDGFPVGNFYVETLKTNINGFLEIDVKPISAVMVTNVQWN